MTDTGEHGREASAPPVPGAAPAAPAGEAPPLPPAVVSALESPAAPVRRRTRGFLPGRVVAGTVFLAVTAATASLVAAQDRSALPGLSAKTDGRWQYPELRLPALPAGSPPPFDKKENPGGLHHADMRDLLVPVPDGGTPVRLKGERDGHVPVSSFLAHYQDRDVDSLAAHLRTHGLRRIVARSWRMPDGTRSETYLLQFPSRPLAERIVKGELFPDASGRPGVELRSAPVSWPDEDFPRAAITKNISGEVFEETGPYGKEHVRHAYLVAGDTVAVILHSRGNGHAARLPFAQNVAVQVRLLG